MNRVLKEENNQSHGTKKTFPKRAWVNHPEWPTLRNHLVKVVIFKVKKSFGHPSKKRPYSLKKEGKLIITRLFDGMCSVRMQ